MAQRCLVLFQCRIQLGWERTVAYSPLWRQKPSLRKCMFITFFPPQNSAYHILKQFHNHPTCLLFNSLFGETNLTHWSLVSGWPPPLLLCYFLYPGIFARLAEACERDIALQGAGSAKEFIQLLCGGSWSCKLLESQVRLMTIRIDN